MGFYQQFSWIAKIPQHDRQPPDLKGLALALLHVPNEENHGEHPKIEQSPVRITGMGVPLEPITGNYQSPVRIYEIGYTAITGMMYSDFQMEFATGGLDRCLRLPQKFPRQAARWWRMSTGLPIS